MSPGGVGCVFDWIHGFQKEALNQGWKKYILGTNLENQAFDRREKGHLSKVNRGRLSHFS